MANSKAPSELSIYWAELRFPPLNLWVMASLPFSRTIAATHKKPINTANNSPRALHKTHRKLETLLAVRGGKV